MQDTKDTTTRVPAVDYTELLDLDVDFMEVTDSEPARGTDRLRAGGATSTCVTYFSAARCPTCY